jgi:hypothetical protein
MERRLLGRKRTVGFGGEEARSGHFLILSLLARFGDEAVEVA